MAVNHIDIDLHKSIGVTTTEAISQIRDYIKGNFVTRGRITLGGHNVDFDKRFLMEMMGGSSRGGEFDNLFMHRPVDTSVILRFLYHVGLLKSDIGSLENALKFFGFSEEALKGQHTAKVDALNTAKLYNHLLRKVANACRS